MEPDLLASVEWGTGIAAGYAIDVWNCRATVSRWQDGVLVEAANWRALEDEAVQAVARVGGAVNMSGQYPCPVELADKARWDEGE